MGDTEFVVFDPPKSYPSSLFLPIQFSNPVNLCPERIAPGLLPVRVAKNHQSFFGASSL
jgi:hypothetical protein